MSRATYRNSPTAWRAWLPIRRYELAWAPTVHWCSTASRISPISWTALAVSFRKRASLAETRLQAKAFGPHCPTHCVGRGETSIPSRRYLSGYNQILILVLVLCAIAPTPEAQPFDPESRRLDQRSGKARVITNCRRGSLLGQEMDAVFLMPERNGRAPISQRPSRLIVDDEPGHPDCSVVDEKAMHQP